MSTEFQDTLKGKFKIYQDPVFKDNPNASTETRIKAWVRDEKHIEEMRAFLATLDRESLSDNPKDSYSKAGYDFFAEDIARWDAGDHSNGDVGFFYCPYLPLELVEGKPFKVRKKE